VNTLSQTRTALSVFSMLLTAVVFCFYLSSPTQAFADKNKAVVTSNEQVTSLTRISEYPLPSQELRYLLKEESKTDSPADSLIREQRPEKPQVPVDPATMFAGPAEQVDMEALAQKTSLPDSELDMASAAKTLSESLIQKVSIFSEATQMFSYSGVNTVVAMFDSLTSNYYQAMNAGPIQAHIRFLRGSPQGMEAKLWTMKRADDPFQSELILEFNY